ncbi:MAG: hypothetical protein Q4F96_01875 [Bacillota bacterium]|nr:hypothetical protein [Bacillota bacterium]
MLQELAEKYRRIAIVGMAKNAGKTTTLNYLLEEAMDEGMICGVTSTGRDGERTDLVTGTDKPSIYLEEDTIVSVPVQLYNLAEAGLEILERTDFGTSLGSILICRVAASGYVQVAGPVINAQHESLCEKMMEYGAEVVLIDGAIDRKSIAAPETSDAIILSTGAVLSRRMSSVVEETAHTVELYSLPELEEGAAREKIEARRDEDQIFLIRDGEVEELDLHTGLSAGKLLAAKLDDAVSHVFFPGAFIPGTIEGIDPRMLRNTVFVLRDATRVFFPAPLWRKLTRWGMNTQVLDGINVAAVTVNPTAPLGYRFDQQALIEAMQKAIPRIPVIDVME